MIVDEHAQHWTFVSSDVYLSSTASVSIWLQFSVQAQFTPALFASDFVSALQLLLLLPEIRL
jgi:hypothetical protein